MHMGHRDMGPTWDPLLPDFQYDSHISLNNSYSNNSTLNEYEFDCYDYMRFGLMCIWDILTWDPLRELDCLLISSFITVWYL